MCGSSRSLRLRLVTVLAFYLILPPLDDGGFCEQEDGNWWCFDSAGVRQNADGSAIAGNEESEAADTSSAGSCVVHGGHTHGDVRYFYRISTNILRHD